MILGWWFYDVTLFRMGPLPWGPWRTVAEWDDLFSCEGEC